MDNVLKKYGQVEAVNHVSYEMKNGVYGLLGVNGAGKTTLIRMLCAITEPTSGEIKWNDENIFELGASYRNILGYLPQKFGFYPDLSVWNYMMYIASIKGIRPQVAKNRTVQLLHQVGMYKYKKRKMKTLSGGMVRRIGIAQAMLNNPKILVLDEPTAGLDPNERIRFRNLISELSKERLVLLSTHIVADIEYIANEIIIMKAGEFLYTGTSETLIASIDEVIWRCNVAKEQVDYYLENYLVANVKNTEAGADLRILTKEPPIDGAIAERPTLEDVFLLYFGNKEGGDFDVEM